MPDQSLDLGEYVGANPGDEGFVAACLVEATALVEQFIGSREVPAPIKARAVLEVGSELFHRRQAPNGIAQFQGLDASPVRVARNPMVAAYPILTPYTGTGLA